MTEYDNNNQGAIWKNDKRQTDKHPHFTGSATINGVDYYVSAWKRDSDSNPKAPALKFSVTQKDALKPAPKTKNDAPFNDDIPF